MLNQRIWHEYGHLSFIIYYYQVQESEVAYRTKIEELEQKLEHYERECSQHETVLNTTVQKNKALIEKLQEEKAMQEVRTA